ncbi:MAG: sulfite exporter TauE/SafE family protein [Candidatus Riflebacteria bacterium]|nr:sulfite exporter TauE/SafE family protein [Candidatus Riflebacteria bacterium]
MQGARALYQAILMASEAHARWELEVSTTILGSRRRRCILFVMVLPILLVSGLLAADLPAILGGKEAYTPSFYTPAVFGVSILIGLCAGLITGCIGAGGGFIITPALMSAGIKGILAVGTDLFHIFAKAIMGTVVHKKLGNVSVTLAIAFLVGSGFGSTAGGAINRTLYESNPVLSDMFINVVYVVLLGFLGFYALNDFLTLRKAPQAAAAHGGAHGSAVSPGQVGLAARLQAVKIPPMITFDEDLIPGGKKISGVFVAICGVFVGFAASIMGVGGGFLTFPMFIYILGVSSFTTVGTDILQIIFTAGYACISQYAIYGFIFYTLAMGMLLGSLIGIQLGALTTKVVKGIYIRGFYAVTILAGFVNRLFAMPGKLNEMKLIDIPRSVATAFDTAGTVIFFIVVGVFTLWVLKEFFCNLRTLRGEVWSHVDRCKGQEVAARYGYPEKEALFLWWTALKGLEKALTKQEKFKEAAFIEEVSRKGVEVGYNFYGIQPKRASEHAGILVLSLVFYLLYTLWWGYAILLLCDGLGLQMKASAKKEI